MKRRKAREHILQALYAHEKSPHDFQLESFLKFIPDAIKPQVDLIFLEKQIPKILNNIGTIDPIVEASSNNWKLSRMSQIDRNILRLAVAEFLYCDDIAVAISMDEAIEIAKKFGTEESPSFINGILDAIVKKLPRNPEKTLH